MFGLNTRRASESFYRNFFALAAFVSFALALLTNYPPAFMAVLAFGALSRTAVRKDWKNPSFASRIPWLVRAPEAEGEEPPSIR